MKILLISITILLSFRSFSQDFISGKLISEKGEPLTKASVFIPNTAIGTTSDDKGEFVLKNLPKGSFRLAISSIGYEVFSFRVPADRAGDPYTFKLVQKDQELESVIVRRYDKAGWSRWGDIFSEAFIGSSSFAQHCKIVNKDIIRFVPLPEDNSLMAYAAEPIIIENKSLGYQITVDLADFNCKLSKNEVDFQAYCFFTAMKGTEEEMVQWKINRAEAYYYSLQYFIRLLYADNFKNKFEIRKLEKKMNSEKQRVLELYNLRFSQIKDSLSSQTPERNLAKITDKSFQKDSLNYYKKVMQQPDRTEKLSSYLLNFGDIAKRTDSNTVILYFSDFLHISDRRKREPVEYYNYRNKALEMNNIMKASAGMSAKPADGFTGTVLQFPSTEFSLTRQLPVEIYENGYINNVDLFIDGFWGWWEKMATRLPYEYNP